MCMHLLLQFYADSFETLQVFRLWAEDLYFFFRLFLLLFSQNELSYYDHFIGITRLKSNISCVKYHFTIYFPMGHVQKLSKR